MKRTNTFILLSLIIWKPSGSQAKDGAVNGVRNTIGVGSMNLEATNGQTGSSISVVTGREEIMFNEAIKFNIEVLSTVVPKKYEPIIGTKERNINVILAAVDTRLLLPDMGIFQPELVLGYHFEKADIPYTTAEGAPEEIEDSQVLQRPSDQRPFGAIRFSKYAAKNRYLFMGGVSYSIKRKFQHSAIDLGVFVRSKMGWLAGLHFFSYKASAGEADEPGFEFSAGALEIGFELGS